MWRSTEKNVRWYYFNFSLKHVLENGKMFSGTKFRTGIASSSQYLTGFIQNVTLDHACFIL